MLPVLFLLALVVVLLFALIALTHFHLLGAKFDNSIASLETRLHLHKILSKVGLDDAVTLAPAKLAPATVPAAAAPAPPVAAPATPTK
jgi:hypothetical protein